jgi:hypothetical protein
MFESKPGAKRVHEMLERNHRLADTLRAANFHLAPFELLQNWQHTRLAQTYSDLMAQDNSRPACVFFLSELYGGLDFRARDQDVERVMPGMKRFLPDNVLVTMAEAFELQAISLEFDMAMAEHLERSAVTAIDTPDYVSAYIAAGNRPERERQIRLIRHLGLELGRLVAKPWVNPLVRLLRGPAHAAGFGNLQTFLETGLSSFLALDDVAAFVDIIYQREWRSMQKLFAGHPDPFGLAQGTREV